MDTGTMTTAGNNWDIINDIFDADIAIANKNKKSDYCGCGASYITADVNASERSKSNNAMKNNFCGSNYFENPKYFKDKRDINAYFEGFEGYPPVMNDPNIYSFIQKANGYESNLIVPIPLFGAGIRAKKDEKAVCGKKPYCWRRCDLQKNKNKDCCVVKSNWVKCINDVRAYNLQVFKEQGGTGAPPEMPMTQDQIQKEMSGGESTGVQQAGMMGGKAIIWIILALVIIGIIVMVMRARKKAQ
jgi:hypothetical protein